MSAGVLDTPLLFEPIYKEKIWGGRNLGTHLAKSLPPRVPIGESWELAGFDTHWSVVRGGEYDGTGLKQLIDTFGPSLLGRLGIHDALPLLYKFIDANDNLSVQVHPDDTRARSNGWGNFGKTECWYIVDARPGAQIIVGLREGVGKGDVEEGIRTNTLDGLLNRIPISPGDMLFMPAGTVHAILEGTLIYEVQESSDTTFRLYDWGRTDADGVSRPLHIPESLAVLDTHYHERHKIAPVTLEPAAGVRRSFRIACTYFVVEEYEMEAGSREVLPPKRSFQVLSVLRGKIALSWPGGTSTVETGETVLIPAALTCVSVGAPEGARFLASSVPELRTEVIEPLRHHGVADSAIALLGGNPRKNDLLPLLAG